MVMALTARSPPYFNREELKHTEITLSLDCITNVESPSARHGKTIDGTGFKYSFLIRKKVFFPVRNARTHPQDTA